MKDKKNTTIGVRVDDDVLKIIKKLAKEDERPTAAMARKLLMEGLKARGLIE
ncbi:hypothetical protein [Cerasicoccus fimbriatus]|uniref:hypothetical protein n=1 Tax=Cerasicoccus fimbriatus TaxID=3014554 RepID=UPI0022B57D4B|nr:hypothetical protein [Cerasicoccus sp. TK19100]